MVQGGPGHRHQEGEEVLRGEEEVRGPRGRDHRPARDQGIYRFSISEKYKPFYFGITN